jgi:hypothetical protein
VASIGGMVGPRGSGAVMIAGGVWILPMCPCEVATATRVMIAVLRVKALLDLGGAGDDGV